MFNPTVIRLTSLRNKTAMVVANCAGDDYYFQVYGTREDGHTFLCYAMPWGSQVQALKAFENWVSCNERTGG